MAMSSRKVAIIGGGISGLSCADRLSRLGISATVFDTGKKYAGGRCSSRYITLREQNIVLDHSAQFFTASDPQFLAWCEAQSEQLRVWDGPMAILNPGNAPKPIPPSEIIRYVGSKGMRSLTQALSSNIDVKIGHWVSAIERKDGQWHLREHSKSLGQFDAVVIAHNGKCADRLLSTANAPRIHDLLRVNFGATLPSDLRRMRKMQLCSLYAMVFVLSNPITTLPYEAAYTKDTNNILSWVCNTSAKIGDASCFLQSWTLISTRQYAAENKVPQEAIPKEKELQIKEDMLAAFCELTNIPRTSLAIEFSRIQLWGAAVPLNRHTAPFVLDGKEHIGICGDWFSSSAHVSSPCIESAWMSGVRLAEELAQGMGTDGVLKDVGFETMHCFEACDATHPLGDVPGYQDTKGVSLKGPPLTPGAGIGDIESDGGRSGAPRKVYVSKKKESTSSSLSSQPQKIHSLKK